jgi:WD40 repeat protein
MPQKPKLKNEQKPRLYLIGGIALGIVLAIAGMLLVSTLVRPATGQVFSSVITELDTTAPARSVTEQSVQTNPTVAPQATVIADRILKSQLSPDGQRLAIARTTGTETTVTLHTLRVTDNLSSDERLLRRIDARVNDLLFHPNGQHMVITTRTDLRVLSLMESNFSAEQYRDAGYTHAAYSPDGNYLAIAGDGNGIRLLDASNFDLRGHYISDARVLGLAFNSRNQIALITPTDQNSAQINIFDVTTLINANGDNMSAPQITYPIQRTTILDMDFHPDGDWLVIAGYAGATAINITRYETSIYPFDVERVHSVAFSDDGDWLVFGGGSSGTGEALLQAVRWNQSGVIPPDPSFYEPVIFNGHTHIISDVAFTANNRLISASYDGSVRLWDVSSGMALSQMRP